MLVSKQRCRFIQTPCRKTLKRVASKEMKISSSLVNTGTVWLLNKLRKEDQNMKKRSRECMEVINKTVYQNRMCPLLYDTKPQSSRGFYIQMFCVCVCAEWALIYLGGGGLMLE